MGREGRYGCQKDRPLGVCEGAWSVEVTDAVVPVVKRTDLFEGGAPRGQGEGTVGLGGSRGRGLDWVGAGG